MKEYIIKYNLSSLVDKLDLNQEINMTTNLSLGEAKQIALLRFMISKKKVYIIDELSASLDREWSDKVESIISDKSKNSIIIRIEHSFNN